MTIPKEYEAAVKALLAQLQAGNGAASMPPPSMIPCQQPSRRRPAFPTEGLQDRQGYPPFEQPNRLPFPFPEQEKLPQPPFKGVPMLPENSFNPEDDESEMTEEDEMDALDAEIDEELQAEIEEEIDEALEDDEQDDKEDDDEQDDESDEKRITEDPDIDHLLVVYRNQNPDEKAAMATKRLNGVGFNKHDAPLLTPLAEKYLADGYLFESEMETVHHLVPKYWRQWTS